MGWKYEWVEDLPVDVYPVLVDLLNEAYRATDR